MTVYFAICVATLVACEIAWRLPLGESLQTLSGTAKRALTVMAAKSISDHWKERILPVYAGRIMKASLLLFACLLAIVLPMVAIVSLATRSLLETGTVLLRPIPLILMVAVGLAYVWLRRKASGGAEAAGRRVRSADYSALDKTLHRVVLGNPILGEMLSDLDGGFSRGRSESAAPVFVTGLARAGTTVLMRALHERGQFASLTYADMPMVLAPNIWAKISGGAKKGRVAKERAHGDGVMVDFDAPEALEEVFWRTHCGTDYIRPDGLVPHVPDAETLDDYRDYQSRVCHRYARSRYLAKNNNMLLRIDTVAQAMPDARFLVPVRDPLAQAYSLMQQHLRFCDSDRFTRDYMTWLVHHEFGPDQRPFRLPSQPVPEGDRAQIDYWLTEWIACYDHLSAQISRYPDQIRPVIYEDLGAGPAAWSAIAAFVGLPAATPSAAFHPAAPQPGPLDADPVLLARAYAIYADLARQAAHPVEMAKMID